AERLNHRLLSLIRFTFSEKIVTKIVETFERGKLIQKKNRKHALKNKNKYAVTVVPEVSATYLCKGVT
ncbi:MAG: hypothetical protein K2J92_07915, partial [Muribaculaceae bacterium]|nr:hypothetical protein [Muribaculaceae bacterium]